MRYALIKHDALDAMARHINDLLMEDWQPLGGCAIAYHPSGVIIYVQTMFSRTLPPWQKSAAEMATPVLKDQEHG